MARLDFLDDFAPPPPRPQPKRRHRPGADVPPPLPAPDPAVDAPQTEVNPPPAYARPEPPPEPPPRQPQRRESASTTRGRAIGSFAEGGGDLYARAKAKKEAYLANLAELEYRTKSGEYVSRDAVRQASATAFAAIAQALRSIPDNLERKLGVTPEVSEAVSLLLDEAMAELASDLQRIHAENA